MQVHPPQLRAALEKGLAATYLVAGEELLLIQESLDLIRTSARARGFVEREILDVERGFDWQRLVESCNSMSLFASQRIVELRIGYAPDATGTATLVALARRPPPDVLLIVTAGKLDWKARKGGWFAALDAAGVTVYAEPVKAESLPAWIEGRISRAGLKALPEAVRLLAQLTEGNLLAASQEVSKLSLLHDAGTVLRPEDVQEAVADSARYEAFGWIDKVLAGDARGAVQALEGLRDEGIEIPQIMGALTGDVRRLITATSAFARTHNAQSAVESANIYPKNRQPAFAKAAARIRPAQARDALLWCARIDALAKSTNGKAAAWEDLLTWTLTASGVVRSGAVTAGA